MKRKALLLSLIGLLGLPSALTISSFYKKDYVTHAEDETIHDMSGKFSWKAENGEFVEIDNWYYSGLGFSYDFKLKDPSASNIKETLITLLNGNNELTAIKDLSTGNYRSHNFAVGKYGGEIGLVVDLGDDWYRYELMLADITPFITASASKTAKVDGIRWMWASATGYYNDLDMKNMKVIDHYSPEALTINGDDGLNHMITAKAPTNYYGSSGGLSQVLSWRSSNKGLSFEFEDNRSTTQHEIVYTLQGIPSSGGSAINMLTNQRCFKSGSIPSGYKGKLFDLGNKWYRFEVMFADFASSQYDDYTFSAINFIWCPDGYGASKYRNFKYIDGYTCNVTYHVGSTTETVQVQGKLDEPTSPTSSDTSKHFGGWYTESSFVNEWDFDNVVTSDMDLYARFVDHDYETKYDETGHWQECECGNSTSKENHTLQEVVDDKYLAKQASCNAAALYYKSCSCGYVSEETFSYGSYDPNQHIRGEVTQINFVEATCEAEGGFDNVIKCEECGEVLETINHVTIPATGHKYEATEWTLSNDKKSATVKLVCEYDANHVITEQATVETEIIPATIEQEGLAMYTLTLNYGGKTFSHTITEKLPKLEPEKTSGCRGSIVTVSVVTTIISLMAVTLLLVKRKEER